MERIKPELVEGPEKKKGGKGAKRDKSKDG